MRAFLEPAIICLLCATPLAILPGQVLPAPNTIIAAESASGEITVTWTAVAGAKDYMLFKATWPNGARSLGYISDTRYVDHAIKTGERYSYLIGARAANGNAGRRARSNEIIAGSASAVAAASPITDTAAKATIVNPQITTPVTATSNTTPVVATSPPPGAEGLATPRSDATSCGNAQGDTSAAARERAQLEARAGRIGARTNADPNQTPTPGQDTPGTVTGSATYREGKCRNGNATGYPDLWEPVASASGLSTADQVAAWKEIGVVALAYKHILSRQPTPAETRRDVAGLRAGTTWKQLWRQLAQSSERDSKFGFGRPPRL